MEVVSPVVHRLKAAVQQILGVAVSFSEASLAMLQPALHFTSILLFPIYSTSLVLVIANWAQWIYGGSAQSSDRVTEQQHRLRTEMVVMNDVSSST